MGFTLVKALDTGGLGCSPLVMRTRLYPRSERDLDQAISNILSLLPHNLFRFCSATISQDQEPSKASSGAVLQHTDPRPTIVLPGKYEGNGYLRRCE